MNLEFYPETHIYKAEGKVVPAVSEITRFIQREVYQEADPAAMDVAADRGIRVHKGCEELDRTGITECDPEIIPYLTAYNNFRIEHDVQWEMIEEPILNEDLWYAGTLDRYGYVDGKATLLDIKTTKRITGKNKLQYAVQLTLYEMIIAKKKGILPDLVVLQLKDDGTYKLIPVDENIVVADACLQLHKAFEKKTKKERNMSHG